MPNRRAPGPTALPRPEDEVQFSPRPRNTSAAASAGPPPEQQQGPRGRAGPYTAYTADDQGVAASLGRDVGSYLADPEEEVVDTGRLEVLNRSAVEFGSPAPPRPRRRPGDTEPPPSSYGGYRDLAPEEMEGPGPDEYDWAARSVSLSAILREGERRRTQLEALAQSAVEATGDELPAPSSGARRELRFPGGAAQHRQQQQAGDAAMPDAQGGQDAGDEDGLVSPGRDLELNARLRALKREFREASGGPGRGR